LNIGSGLNCFSLREFHLVRSKYLRNTIETMRRSDEEMAKRTQQLQKIMPVPPYLQGYAAPQAPFPGSGTPAQKNLGPPYAAKEVTP